MTQKLSKKQQAFTAYEQGDLSSVVQLLSKYCPKHRTDIAAWQLLGLAHNRLNQPEKALPAFEQINRIKPAVPEILCLLGVTNKRLGRIKKAIDCFQHAEQLGCQDPELYYQLAIVLEEAGSDDDAVQYYQKAIAANPENYELYSNLGLLYINLQQYESAITSLNKAHSLAPEDPIVLNNLGLAYDRLDEKHSAEQALEQALKLEPCLMEAWFNLADLYIKHKQQQQAINCLLKAEACQPFSPRPKLKLATGYIAVGEFNEAEACLWKAIDIDPTCVDAWFQLSTLTNQSVEKLEYLASQMKSRVSLEKLKPRQQAIMSFALANTYEQSSDFDRSFEYYLQANSLMRQEYSYDVDETQQEFQSLIQFFTPELIKKYAHAGLEDASPIFIVGMPRSGTTLLEQILASHSQVFGAGELPFLRQLVEGAAPTNAYLSSLEEQGDKFLKRVAQSYLDKTRKMAPANILITDKMPHNFKFVGLIRLLFPNAKVIHCRRDPMDTCFSIFTQYFTGWHPYAYSLDELGNYYLLYQRLMEHWDSLFQGFMHEIHYEQLVENQEQETQRLLDYIGLAMEPACLDFQRSRKPVNTATATQVRQGMYRHAIQRWRRHETNLAGLKHILTGAKS